MEVILREDVKTLGRAGELVKVKAGYARNFLLPQGLAYEASEGNRKRIAAESKAREARRVAERGEAEAFASKLAGASVVLTRKAGEEGRLFGSITAQDIADALAAQGHYGGSPEDRVDPADQDGRRSRGSRQASRRRARRGSRLRRG